MRAFHAGELVHRLPPSPASLRLAPSPGGRGQGEGITPKRLIQSACSRGFSTLHKPCVGADLRLDTPATVHYNAGIEHTETLS